MNQALIDTVVHAVLYEGYILYPYRARRKKTASASPSAASIPRLTACAENGAEPCLMQTQCLVEGGALGSAGRHRPLSPSDGARHRRPRRAAARTARRRIIPISFTSCPSWKSRAVFTRAGRRRSSAPFACRIQALSALSGQVRAAIPFSFPASRSIEPILDQRKHIAGVIVRRQEAVVDIVELTVEPVRCVGLQNHRPHREPDARARRPFWMTANEIVMRTFASTHTILHAPDGAISLADRSSPTCTRMADTCRNLGTWPILVGDEEKNRSATPWSPRPSFCTIIRRSRRKAPATFSIGRDRRNPHAADHDHDRRGKARDARRG